MRIIAVMSPKGGIGKTTTSDAIAYMLGEEQEKRVLILDGDPQGDTSKTFEAYEPEGTGMSELLERHVSVGGSYRTTDLIRPTQYSHIDIIPANGYLMQTDMKLLLKQEANQVTRLRDALEEISEACDELHFATGAQAMIHKMKLEAMKHQGTRNDLETTSRQVVGKLEAADTIGEQTGESGRQVQRFIRLTNLIPEILDMVDEKKIAFNPAVELSYLKPSEQKEFLEAMDYAQASPSLSQAQRLKKLSQEGGCTLDAMCEVMNEIKKDELDHVTIKNEVLRKYFPKSYTPKQMQDTIIRLLEKWQRSKQRDMGR